MNFNEFFILICSFMCPVLQGYEWVLPEKIVVPTVFFPGMRSSCFTQMARYTGPDGFVTLKGEHVYSELGIHTIHHPCLIDAEIDDIEHQKSLDYSWIDLFDPRVGLTVWNKKMYFRHTNRDRLKYGVRVENVSPEETVCGYYAPLSTVNFAQQRDLRNHKRKFDACVATYPDVPRVLYGVSRGAATTFRACAQYADEYTDVRMVILEGCFDNVSHNLKARYPLLCYYSGVHGLLHNTLTIITSYKKDGGSPLDDVDTFPKNLPVVFITSEVDDVVPAECTKNLVAALVNAGHQEVYLLKLQSSSHSRYMMDNEDDANTYQSFIHALYKKYNLPYIEAYAQQGEVLVNDALVVGSVA